MSEDETTQVWQLGFVTVHYTGLGSTDHESNGSTFV